MTTIHTGFDGIDLALKTIVPIELVEFLEEGKATAQELMTNVWGTYEGWTFSRAKAASGAAMRLPLRFTISGPLGSPRSPGLRTPGASMCPSGRGSWR